MIIQSNNYSCGPAAIVNACLALGHVHDIIEVAQLAGTTSKLGTDERGIKSALISLEYTVTEILQRTESLWTTLFAAITRGNSAILCVDDNDHWIAIIGVIGSVETGRLVGFDSERTTENQALSGVRIYDRDNFVDRLGESRYAIAVGDVETETDSIGNELMTSLAQMIGTSATEFTESSDNDSLTGDELDSAIFGGRR